MSGPDLRERRRLSTRREITRAALDLVLARGLANVTVDDIAASAGISPRTFFNYFPSKKLAVIAGPEPPPDDAVEEFVTDRKTPVLTGLRVLLGRIDVSSAEQRTLLFRTQRVIMAHPELVPVLHERVLEFERMLANAVARRLDAGTGDPRPPVAAAVCGALMRVAVTGIPARDDDTAVKPEQPDETRPDETLHASLDQAFVALQALFTS